MTASPGPQNAASGQLTPGSRFGEYRITRLLGRGGMGVVYEAESLEDGRQIAIKLLDHDLNDPDARRRFLREGQLAASLNHPNTVYIYGTEDIDGTPIISMELLSGGTLEEQIESRGPLPIPETLEDILQIVDGLAAAHALGVLHRDVKPSNCFVALDGTIKVGDFGLSKSVTGGKDSRITKTGVFMGTPAFSAAEQLLGEPLDVRSDIYSVGATLYNMLTGKLPFEASSAVAMVAVVLQGSPISPKARRPEIPAALAAIVLKCMNRKPELRYPDYGALRADLEALQPTLDPPAPLSNRFTAGFIDLMVVTLALGAILTLFPALDSAVPGQSDLRSNLIESAIILALLVLINGIPEAFWGTSIGKSLAGISVQQTGGGWPGLGKSLGRVGLMGLPFLLSDLADALPGWGAWPGLLVWLGALGLLFSPARRTNGYAALHDRLTGTHVVRRFLRRSRGVSRAHLQPIQSTDAAIPELGGQLGPYGIGSLLSKQPDGSRVFNGFDPVLKRSVWLHLQAAGTPPLAQQRRQLARSGRLRWVASRRNAQEAWDAYEAVPGLPLRGTGERPVRWQTCQQWLADLAGELEAAQVDGSVPEKLSLDLVWIARDGRAILADFPVTGAEQAGPVLDPLGFLRQVADLAVQRDDGAKGKTVLLPMHARQVIDQLGAGGLAEIRRGLADTRGLPDVVSRRTRALLIAGFIVPGLILGATIWTVNRLSPANPPEIARLKPLFEYTASHLRPADSDSLVRANLNSIRIYLAAKHGLLLADSVRRVGLIRSLVRESRRASVDSVLRDLPPVDSAVGRRAVVLVEQEWKWQPPGSSTPDPLLNAAIGAVTLSLMTGLFAVVLALVARRGLMLRLLGVEIVTATGRPAGRLRLLARGLVTWAPPILIVILAIIRRSHRYSIGILIGISVALLAGWLLGMIAALLHPEGGPAERMTGTYLVPN